MTTGIALVVAVLGGLRHWIADVVERIGDVSPYLLVLALALKTGESGLIGLAWRNILRASYPESEVRLRRPGARHRAAPRSTRSSRRRAAQPR